MAIFGLLSTDIILDQWGAARAGTIAKLYASQALANAGGTPLTFVRTGPGGRFEYSNDALATVWARTLNGTVLEFRVPGAAADDAVESSTYLRGAINTIDAPGLGLYFPEAHGAVGDCDSATGAGTDDIIALQETCDAAKGKGVVYLQSPAYRVTDTLTLGAHGAEVGFFSLTLRSPAAPYRGESGFAGSVIVSTVTDRSAINVQSGRRIIIEDVAIRGQLFDWVTDHTLGSMAGATGLDDVDGASWVDPTHHVNSDSRYAPYAAITIDAYSGAAPTPCYPGTYGKGASQKTTIQRVEISGFNTAIANQPSDYDGDGDYTDINHVHIEKCKYGISVGNTQSRALNINHVQMSNVWTCLTNSTHGKRQGMFQGTISNLSVQECTYLLDAETSNFGPVTFLHPYVEALYALGRLEPATSTAAGVRFESGLFKFSGQSAARGVPGYVLTGAGSAANFEFSNCVLMNFPSVLSFESPYVKFSNGTRIISAERYDGAPANAYQRLAHNGLAGGVVCRFMYGNRTDHDMSLRQFDVDTGAVVQSYLNGGAMTEATSRSTCIPIYANRVGAQLGGFQDSFDVRHRSGTIDKASLTVCTLTGKTLTITFASRSDATFAMQGPDVGDVLVDDLSGMVFFVRSRTGTTILATAQNNYRDTGGSTFVPVTAFVAGSGVMYIGNTRLYTPTYYLQATLTAASGVLTGCGRDDGWGGFIDTDIAVGDQVVNYNDHTDKWTYLSNSDITARDGTAGTITISAGVIYSQDKKRLGVLIRKAAPNA